MQNEYLASLEGVHLPMHPSLAGSPLINGVKNAAGTTWGEFRASLKPRFGLVARDLAVNFAMLGLTFLPFFHYGRALPFWSVPLLAIWAGFWWHTMLLFLHEAAHYNIAPSRRLNDLLGNLLLMPLVGIDIASYRDVHWKHHLNLGDDGDTEISYLNPISLSQMLLEFLGVNALRSLLRYFDASAPAKQETARSPLFVFGLLLLLAAQAAVIGGLGLKVSPAAGLSWALAFWFVTPLCNKLRQTLEHRSMNAGNRKLFSPTEQGPVLRLFGSDWLSSKFGEAGFNRHLLHHWDPAISYTRVPEMEAFFMQSDLRQVVLANKSSYLKTFMVLAA